MLIIVVQSAVARSYSAGGCVPCQYNVCYLTPFPQSVKAAGPAAHGTRPGMKKLGKAVNPRNIKGAASSVMGSIQAVPKRSWTASRAAAGRVTTGSKQALESATSLANGLLATTQGVLTRNLLSEK